MTPQERNFLILLHAFANVVTDREGEVADFNSVDFLTAAHPLLAHIYTLESELQQLKVERDRLRIMLVATMETIASFNGEEINFRIGKQLSRLYNHIAAALSPAPAARTETK